MSVKIPKSFWTLVRSYSASVHGPSATAGDHAGGTRMWKMLSFLVALPGVGVCFINAQLKEKEEHEHFHRPEFKPYAHLRLRTKLMLVISRIVNGLERVPETKMFLDWIRTV